MKNGNGHFKIEDGIPIPPARGGKGYSGALRSLKKGQSVLLPTSIQSVHSAIIQMGEKGRFTCRKEADGTRAWRIK